MIGGHTMKILALGAGGEMGATAAKILAHSEIVSQVYVADRDLKSAQAVASKLGSKAIPLQIDATDHAALITAMKSCDLVVNTVGPYFRFGTPILTAAIEAKCNYVDICDDPEPTLEMLQLTEKAKKAGVTALICTGSSPGIANMLAVIAARELDKVESIVTGWNIAAAQPEACERNGVSAAVVHIMAEISGTIPVFREGKLGKFQALENIKLEYPGLGNFNTYTIGHPEVVTLQRAFPSIKENINVCVGDKITIRVLKLFQKLINLGILNVDRAAFLIEKLFSLMPSNTSDIFKTGSPPPLFAVAKGIKAGKESIAATALAQTPGFTMAAATGVPLAVCALLMLARKRENGVHTLETLIEPEEFFSALAPYCIGSPSPEKMTATTTSWANSEENKKSLHVSLGLSLLAQ